MCCEFAKLFFMHSCDVIMYNVIEKVAILNVVERIVKIFLFRPQRLLE